jgi:hypothetical protein
MLLSEAIRLGAMSKPQGTGVNSANPSRSSVCVIGAALFAIGVQCECWDSYDELKKAFPLADQPIICPKSGIEVTITKALWMLNDDGWTRERIADWVESIERERGMWDAREQQLVRETQGMLEVLETINGGK